MAAVPKIFPVLPKGVEHLVSAAARSIPFNPGLVSMLGPIGDPLNPVFPSLTQTRDLYGQILGAWGEIGKALRISQSVDEEVIRSAARVALGDQQSLIEEVVRGALAHLRSGGEAPSITQDQIPGLTRVDSPVTSPTDVITTINGIITEIRALETMPVDQALPRAIAIRDRLKTILVDYWGLGPDDIMPTRVQDPQTGEVTKVDPSRAVDYGRELYRIVNEFIQSSGVVQVGQAHVPGPMSFDPLPPAEEKTLLSIETGDYIEIYLNKEGDIADPGEGVWYIAQFGGWDQGGFSVKYKDASGRLEEAFFESRPFHEISNIDTWVRLPAGVRGPVALPQAQVQALQGRVPSTNKDILGSVRSLDIDPQDKHWIQAFWSSVDSGYYSAFLRNNPNAKYTSPGHVYSEWIKREIPGGGVAGYDSTEFGPAMVFEEGSPILQHIRNKYGPDFIRVVVGWHGPYVELATFPGRTTFVKKHIQYDEFEDTAGNKLYYQKSGVNYADYKPGMWYISLFDAVRDMSKVPAEP